LIPIQNLIDKALEPEERKPRSGKWSPHAFGRCYRYQYWLRKNETPTDPPDKRVLRIFAVGKMFHNFVQDLIKDTEKEVLCETDDVKGYADLVNTDEVIDIKSQHSFSFWHRKKEENNIKEKLYPNWLQVMWYAKQLGKKRGRLVFVSKDDLCIQEYTQDLDDYWEGELTEELNKLRVYWEGNILPKPEPRAYKNAKGEFKECGYCSFKTKCLDSKKG